MFSSCLTDRTHYVSLSNHCSAVAPVHSVVPLGSVLGPILSTMYIKPLSAIMDSHSITHHSFAIDMQLQMSAPPDEISELLNNNNNNDYFYVLFLQRAHGSTWQHMAASWQHMAAHGSTWQLHGNTWQLHVKNGVDIELGKTN